MIAHARLGEQKVPGTFCSPAPLRGGPLVWTTAVVMALGAYAIGLASGRSELLLAAGLGLVVPLVFAWRLEAGGLRLCAILVTSALAYPAAATPAAVARLLAAIVASALIPAAVGLGQWARGTTHTIGDLHRATGTFLQPDPYGIYLAIAALAALT